MSGACTCSVSCTCGVGAHGAFTSETLTPERFRRPSTTWPLPDNRFHPMVYIGGEPEIGEGTSIGLFSEINAKGSTIKIGKGCDIASFVAINVADSHKQCIGLADDIERRPIEIGDHVFVGSHAFIGGGVRIGHHSVIAAGARVTSVDVPPYSLVVGSKVRKGYYR